MKSADVSIEFFDAGHILGSVGTLIRAEGRTIFYTGDVQFDDQTIMQGARFPEHELDVLIIETTRGDRATPGGLHPRAARNCVSPTRSARNSTAAPACSSRFSRSAKRRRCSRCFTSFRRRGLLGLCPIYIGGLSTKLTEIYDKLAHHTPRQQHDLQILDAVAPFTMAGKAADATPLKGERIYAISSGMMTEKTLSNSFARQVLSDPAHALFFVGYADPALARRPHPRRRSAATPCSSAPSFRRSRCAATWRSSISAPTPPAKASAPT